MFTGQLALCTAAIFFGAALYVNLVEQPARLHLDDRALLIEWKPSYKRGFAMQAPLAIVGFLLGVIAWWQTADWRWLVGGLILFANWPFTLFAIMPVNRIMMSLDPSSTPDTLRDMMQFWGRMHGWRTAFGFIATVIFLWASVRSYP